MRIFQTRLPAAGVLGACLLLAAGSAAAEKLVMPKGMGGVPDIGAIPCEIFNQMMVVGPLGTRHSLLTWTAGYVQAFTGRSLQDVADAADVRNGPWTYDRLADELVAYCKANPQAAARQAAVNLARTLGVGGFPPAAGAAMP